jgi:glycosyltransferase involved in cell wall biosynthesis
VRQGEVASDEQKLERDCVVDLRRGLFTDQKWVEFAPCFCERVEIVRHPGWNVAYWNLPTRHVVQTGDRFTVDGQPFVFFHFSGYDPDRGEFSRHQDRYTMSSIPTAVAELASDYAAKLTDNGYPETKSQTYAHTDFADGTPIPDAARKVFREQRDELAQRFPDPVDTDAAALISYLNEPVVRNGRSSPLISRIMWEVLDSYPQLFLREHFPDPLGAHATGFAEWFVGPGQEIHRLADVFVRPVREAMSGDARPAASKKSIAKWLYQFAWRLRHVAAFVPFETRQRIAAVLFRRAYVDNDATSRRTTAHAGTPPGRNGLNVVGYLRGELGLGEAAATIPAAAIDFDFEVASRREEEIPGGFTADPEFDITLLHLNAEHIPQLVAVSGVDLLNRYTIGFWNWELPELPDSWLEAESVLDEVWAPTHFCHVAFSRKLRIPVTHIPYAIDVAVPAGVGRRELGLPDDEFMFLQIFDALSVPERKNPMATIEAYQRARPDFRGKTRLVVKLINGDRESELLSRLRRAVADDDSIIVSDRYLHRPELNALFNSVDACVSLHRAEGFGLTVAESMCLGKPVIATGWSGNMDFMTPWNSVPVPYKLVQIERDHGPYPAGQWWADPDPDAAAAAMIRIANEPEYAAELGSNAAHDIRANNSPAAIGRIIQSRLDVINR